MTESQSCHVGLDKGLKLSTAMAEFCSPNLHCDGSRGGALGKGLGLGEDMSGCS
jgi:hypothetical protein